MTTLTETVSKYKDLQFIPINRKKEPMVIGWQKTKANHSFLHAEGIGLVCGSLSGNLQAVDIDCKYDLTGQLFEKYKKAIAAADKELLAKLVVQKTRSNGYHFIFRCEKMFGNVKLANRPTTEKEREDTFNETYKKQIAKGDEKDQAEAVAKRSARNDRERVLLETRGEGGYVAVFPTNGYHLIYGDLSKINTITGQESDTLVSVARSFNEVVKEYVSTERKERKQIKGLTPFEDYNNRADVVKLLEDHGWSVVDVKGRKTLMLRPGSSTSASSGNWDEEKNWFTVFSTSTDFEVGVAYLPYAVFAFLETKKDFSVASKKLYEMGFGDRYEEAKKNDSKTPSRIDLLDEDFKFLAKPDDYDDYLEKWRTGKFEKGLSTGFRDLDKHFVFKRANLVVINGHDNVGKSTVIWYLALISSLLHGWNWIIFSSENTVGSVVKKLIEFYWCKQINYMKASEYAEAKKFVENHFSIIKCDNELYNYRDILNMATLLSKKKKYDSLLIDPYNSLKIELTAASKLSTHEYHYEAVSELRLFTKQNDMAIYVNCHAVTNALRQVGADKMAQAPQKADTEGGGKFSNKADDFITIHRKVQSPDEWMFSELHIRKIKETETGGRTTPLNAPVRIKMVRGLVGFDIDDTNNPVLDFHKIPHTMPRFDGPGFSEQLEEAPF